MASLTESAALVTLLRTGKRPWSVYTDLVEEAGSALAVLEDERGQRLFGGIEHDLKAPGDEIRTWQRDGMRMLTVLDKAYPDNLRAVHDRPPLIFVAGGLESRDARSIAVVGARDASPQGVTSAERIAAHLVDAGFTVVSGLAAGIDTAAHSSALGNGGRTVAVIGTGLGRAYPPQNAALQRRIAAEGAVLSQFWPDAPPTKRTFPMRNAVMSGLTLATVVVEAAHTSGARMQARLALAQGRPVFLRDSLLRHEWAQAAATRPGTHTFREPEEITAMVARLTAHDTLTA